MRTMGKTLIPQELEIMNAVKSGSIAMGSPAGAAATVFPEMGVLSEPVSQLKFPDTGVVTSSFDKTARIWGVGRATTLLRGHSGEIFLSQAKAPGAILVPNTDHSMIPSAENQQ
jgi:hypothetical protein